MKSKSLLFYLLVSYFLYPSLSWALLIIEPGVYSLEGKLIKYKDRTYFSINYGNNAETRFKLKGNNVSNLQVGSNALIKVKVEKETASFLGEAEYIELIKYLDPFEEVKGYNSEDELVE